MFAYLPVRMCAGGFSDGPTDSNGVCGKGSIMAKGAGGSLCGERDSFTEPVLRAT